MARVVAGGQTRVAGMDGRKAVAQQVVLYRLPTHQEPSLIDLLQQNVVHALLSTVS